MKLSTLISKQTIMINNMITIILVIKLIIVNKWIAKIKTPQLMHVIIKITIKNDKNMIITIMIAAVIITVTYKYY